MKIIKKLCIPLLSLVLVLSCFTVSQMDASAAMSANDHIGPGYNQGGGDHRPRYPSSLIGTHYPAEEANVACVGYVPGNPGNHYRCSCPVYRDAHIIYDDGDPFGILGACDNCGHDYDKHHRVDGGGSSGGNGSYVPSHTHNYSTTWGAWRKISSCRLPG